MTAEVYEVEIGHPGGIEPTWTPDYGHGWVASGYEEVPELVFPWSIAIYDRMRRTESQLATILRAINLPILGADWHLDDTGVRPEVITLVRTELGLPEPGKAKVRRKRDGIVLREHLRMALLALPFGFMPFERTYEIGAPTEEQESIGLPVIAHLHKLSPRLPRTLTEIRVYANGELEGIVQAAPGIDTSGGVAGTQYIGRRDSASATTSGDVYRQKLIEARNLVMYVNEREGGDWAGTSILRNAYKDWFIKDQLLRVGAQAVERNGMGLPVVTYDSNHSKAEALELAKAIRAGAHAGVAVPEGMKLELLGVTGTTKDELPRVVYHDQAMSKAALAMFLDLGHDRGAQNLGETFLDIFTMAEQATVDTLLSDTFTETVIRDLVAQNFGVDEPYPTLTCSPMSSESTLTADAMKMLVDAKVITPDDDLEKEVRRRHGLPDMGKPRNEPTPPTLLPGLPGVPGPAAVDDVPQDDDKADPTQLPTAATHVDQVLARADQLVRRIAALRADPGV